VLKLNNKNNNKPETDGEVSRRGISGGSFLVCPNQESSILSQTFQHFLSLWTTQFRVKPRLKLKK